MLIRNKNYKDSYNGIGHMSRIISCIHITLTFSFQSELRLMINFTADLNNTNSTQFKSLARDVEKALLPPLKRIVPGVVDIDTGSQPSIEFSNCCFFIYPTVY